MENVYVIKIGSQLLTKENGDINKNLIKDFVNQCSEIIRDGKKIVLISSGAVSSGRIFKDKIKELKIINCANNEEKKTLEEQMLSSIGQPRLMSRYIKEFGKYNFFCAQCLVTKSDFVNRQRYISQKTVALNLLANNIVPIFNENDFLSPDEINFSDNDQLACIISAMLGADLLIILTNVDGVYDKNPKINKDALIISEIANPLEVAKKSSFEKSRLGRGGMESKLVSADLITSLGIPMRIANGNNKNIILKIIRNQEKIGTYFPVKRNKQSSLKTWLKSAAHSKGKIIVSTYLADLLENKKFSSILLAGVERIEGEFDKNEVVLICNLDGKELGKGLVRSYSAASLTKAIKKSKETGNNNLKDKNIVIHYDYFVFTTTP